MLPIRPLPFLWHFVKQQKFKFFFCALATFAWAANDAVFPYLLNRLINHASTYSGEHLLKSSLGLLGLLSLGWIVMSALTRIGGFLELYTVPNFKAQIRMSVFNYAKWHSLNYFSNNFAGSLARKLADLPGSCQTLVENILFQFLPALTYTAGVLFLLYMEAPLFGLIVSAWLSIHFGLCGFFLKRTNALYQKQSEATSTLSGKIVDSFTNILTVRLFARTQTESDYLSTYQKDEVQKSQKALFTMEICRVGLSINGLILILSTLFLSIYGLQNHWLSLGQFTQISMQTWWLLGWMWFIGYQMGVFSRELGQVKDALGILSQPHEVVDVKNAPPLHLQKGEVSFQDVSFSYPNGQLVFENLNLHIPAGQKVGLVGFSGAGKSTFVNLILRFYDLNAGQILLDSQNIAHVQQESLRSQISLIPQDPSLFHRSLKENIAYGKEGATEDEILAAAKRAHCDEFIQLLPEKYESLVGERGVRLSGGQRQRVAIARAILKNSPLLLLDEATSALDSVTERLIQRSLKQLMKNRTTIVVAHRLSTLSHMDRILVFEQGKIIEDGTPEELLKQNGPFSKLWEMQKEGFLPTEIDSK